MFAIGRSCVRGTSLNGGKIDSYSFEKVCKGGQGGKKAGYYAADGVKAGRQGEFFAIIRYFMWMIQEKNAFMVSLRR